MAADGWITPKDAALRLGCSGQWVRDLCDMGRLRVQRTPLGRLVHAESVERYKREREARLSDE